MPDRNNLFSSIKEKEMKKRMINPYFWIGVIATLILAVGVDPAQLTSWDMLGHEIMGFLASPFLIGTAIVALVTVYIDPTTGGLKDSPTYVKEEEHE
jgi:phi LC3 family holin